MERSRAVLILCENIEIAERDWLIGGLLWIAIGTLALSPLGIVARAGRLLFAFALCAHAIEAVYVAFRARTARLSAQRWFLNTLVLGSVALMAMELHLRKVLHRRSVK